MINSSSRFSAKDLFFAVFLVSMACIYAIHLFSFTLFDGFTTLSNDAGGYVILARKWSPFFAPELAEILTWPTQVYPPGFAWALAIFGASETLYASHLFVSVCMLAGILLAGWIAYRKLGWLIGGMLALALCSLPGVVISSMGILSENLYLLISLAALVQFSSMRKNADASPVQYLVFLILLSLVVLTRSIGIALIGAIATIVMFDGKMVRKQKIAFGLTVLCSIALWQLWGLLNPQPSEAAPTDYFALAFKDAGSGLLELMAWLWKIVMINLVQLVSSWNHYLSLSHPHVYFFMFSVFLLLFCLIGLALRLLRGAPDAVYLIFYLAILAVWPYPGEMIRFLHPVIFLIILQPALYFMKSAESADSAVLKTLVFTFTLGLFINSLIIQRSMLDLRNEAVADYPFIAHSLEYYAPGIREEGKPWAFFYGGVMHNMSESAGYLPKGSIVASVKHEVYTVLSGLASVNLVGIVPLEQQLCNLKIKNVDAVFISNLTTAFNPNGLSLVDDYADISAETVTSGGEQPTYVLKIDKTRLNAELNSAGSDCQDYKQY